MSFAPGALVGGRYELGRQLGAGGMARVYLAHDRLLGREVAVKVLSEPYASDPSFVERFRREASAAAGLNHPNIVAVYDRGEADGSYYIVMEYLSGPDLKEVLRRRAPLPPEEAVDNALQILAALGAAHRRDVIHRDVKPQNVLIAEDGHLKVTDFGIARAGAQSDMTEAGSVIGTAQYLSPEQARGDEVTAASDCYAVGIVLYEMLTGRVPFDGDRAVTVAMKQISDAPPPAREVEPRIPPELEAVVMRALAKRPSERYRTAEEFTRALVEAREAMGGGLEPTRVMAAAGPATAETRPMEAVTGPTRIGPPPPPEPPRRRRRWPIVAGVLLALLALGAVAFALLSGNGTSTVTIPDVAGADAASAERQLTELGLEVTRQTVSSDEVEEGRVVETRPAAGTEVEEGSTVTLRVSGGPGDAPVPDVVGATEDDARLQISQAGFEVDVQSEASDSVEEDRVIRQDPEGGSEAELGSTVTIVVSTGPERVTVPDVRQRPQSEAEQRLRDAGLTVGSVTTEPSTRFSPGTVIRQDPGPTASADRGSSVDLVVAAAPETIAVPDVIGNNAREARRKLEDAGFRVTSNEAESEEPEGIVIDQSPRPGIQVAPGQPVNITVSSGPPEPDEGGNSGAPGGGGQGPDGLGPPGQRR